MIAAARLIDDPNRGRDIKTIHAMKRELALAEESYRALVSKASNARTDSSASLAAPERARLLDDLRRLGAGKKKGHRRQDQQETSLKLRALWISAHHLGIVRDPTESGLAAFVKRQCKVDDLRFLRPSDSHAAIEAVKAWMEREGLVNWAAHPNPRICVVYAQWLRLRQLGAFTKVPPAADGDALDKYVSKQIGPAMAASQLTDDQADKVVVTLGAWVRSQVKKNAGL
ncbi:MAG: regulatory protein GemA [Alphaproteobacteria bacterium]|nr:regulatory protein GemA [Alphaproteobacteria bacterium]